MLSFNPVFFDIGETLVSDRAWVAGAREALQRLRAMEVRLGLISNTHSLSRDQLKKLLPSDFSFDVFEDELVVLSSEVGVEKPDLQIFLLAIQRAGVPPWQCAFVGEKLTETIVAQEAGMKAVRIANVPEDFEVIGRIGT